MYFAVEIGYFDEIASFVNLTVVEGCFKKVNLCTAIQGECIFFTKLYDRYIQPSLLLWRKFTRKESFILQLNGLLKPKNKPRRIEPVF
jgi:hypothetical protein